MEAVVARPVTTWRQRKQFLDLPWAIYGDDPNWVPRLRVSEREMVGFHYHPFYDENKVQTFLAYRGKEVCGRIAAILNNGHIQRYGERRGFFGFFECRDDEEAARALFQAAADWLAQFQVFAMRGPANPSLNYECGLLVDGFDSPPMFLMTYNPPYYERLIQSYGFRKVQDLYAYWGKREMLPAVAQRWAGVCYQIIEHLNITFRTLRRGHFFQDVEELLSIYNRSLVDTWGFVPMSPKELRYTAKSLRFLVVPELVVGAMSDGKLVGSVLGLPDFNPRIKQIGGRLFPFGFLRLLWRKNRIKAVRVISTNVIPEYQRQGVGLVLLHGLVPQALGWGMQEAEFSWVLESNRLSRRSLEKGGAKLTKTYRMYDFDPAG